jgi:hypothetical protein
MSADDEALLLRGQTPDARPELQMLGQSLAEFRGAALGLAPRASASLAQRLASNEPLPEGEALAIAVPARRRVRVGRIAAASIAAAMIVSALGSANVLPPAAQVVFDRVVPTALPTNENSPAVPAVPVQPTSVSNLDDTPVDDAPAHPQPPAHSPAPDSTAPGNSGNGNGHGENSGNANGNGNKGTTNPGTEHSGGKRNG